MVTQLPHHDFQLRDPLMTRAYITLQLVAGYVTVLGDFGTLAKIPNMVDSTQRPIAMTHGHTFSPRLLVMVHYRTG